MIRQLVTRVSLDSFREKSTGKKVVLLYPWTNYRNLFLGHFLASAKEGLLYYRIPQGITVLPQWLDNLVGEFQSVVGNFGSHLRQALHSGSPKAMGEALAADLQNYSSSPVTLYIDELDRIPFDETFTQFIETAVASLPAHAQLVFSSRLLTYEPWYQMVVDGRAVVLGTERRKNDVMFTVEETPKPQVEVYAFGRGHAVVNGQEIANWDGALPRNLFFYFIDNPLVTRDDIFDTFWPNLSIKEATNVFHVTKRKISERISLKVEDADNYELTLYASGFYMPSDKVVRHYDVDDFQEAVERASITSDVREEENLLRRAIDLYKAPFLETIHMPWVEERRDHLRQLYAQALINMGRINQHQNELPKAISFYIRALRETPEREDIHREVMQLYIQLGMLEDARRQYQAAEKILGDTLKIPPSAETRQLYESIQT